MRFKCDLCTAVTFSTMSNKRRHYRRQHNMELPHSKGRLYKKVLKKLNEKKRQAWLKDTFLSPPPTTSPLTFSQSWPSPPPPPSSVVDPQSVLNTPPTPTATAAPPPPSSPQPMPPPSSSLSAEDQEWIRQLYLDCAMPPPTPMSTAANSSSSSLASKAENDFYLSLLEEDEELLAKLIEITEVKILPPLDPYFLLLYDGEDEALLKVVQDLGL